MLPPAQFRFRPRALWPLARRLLLLCPAGGEKSLAGAVRLVQLKVGGVCAKEGLTGDPDDDRDGDDQPASMRNAEFRLFR